MIFQCDSWCEMQGGRAQERGVTGADGEQLWDEEIFLMTGWGWKELGEESESKTLKVWRKGVEVVVSE